MVPRCYAGYCRCLMMLSTLEVYRVILGYWKRKWNYCSGFRYMGIFFIIYPYLLKGDYIPRNYERLVHEGLEGHAGFGDQQ